MESDNVLRIDWRRVKWKEGNLWFIACPEWVKRRRRNFNEGEKKIARVKELRGRKQILLMFEQIIAFTLHLSIPNVGVSMVDGYEKVIIMMS
jgi:hypothetical protein